MECDDGVPLSRARKEEARWRRLLKRRLPILEWGPRYDRTAAVADLVAGITLGLTLVPQSIAYASLANLPVQYGLYSSFIGTMLYVVLGTVKEVSIGPTSLMALLTLQITRGLPIEFVVLLTFLSGCIVLLMGLLRLGFLVDLISPSVTSGFTSATAVIIVVAQLKGLLGLSFVAETVYDNVSLIVHKWHEVRVPDVILGLCCCSVLLALRKLKDLPVSPKKAGLKKFLWLVSIGRNALVVLLAATFAYLTHDPQHPLVKLSGRVEAGLPRVSLPPWSAPLANGTVALPAMAQRLGAGLLMMPVVMVLANIAIAKAFCRDGRVDATQEMLTLGLCNVAGSLVHAMPTCGAFTRSAVSHSSGVRSPAAGLYSGIITLLALVFLTQHFYYIPKACLSSVLICAVIFMVDVGTARRLWRRGPAGRRELGVLALTFGAGLARSVELAVLAGALASLAALLLALRRPQVALHTLKTSAGEVCRVRLRGAVVYLNAERVLSRALRAGAASPRPALLDCGALHTLDYSATQMFERLISKLNSGNQKVIFYNACADVAAQLEAVAGVDARSLRLASPEAALAAVAVTSPVGETTALLQDKTDDNV